MIRAYLAGPDVFLAHADAHAARKRAICAAHGIEGLAPLNENLADWRRIFAKDVAMMEAADIVIANLTPFRGPSADAGTLVELGWFLGRGKPIFAYSNSARGFAERSKQHVAAVPDPFAGIAVEGFGLADNLMIPGAVEASGHGIVLPPEGVEPGFDDLGTFTRCVVLAAEALKQNGGLRIG